MRGAPLPWLLLAAGAALAAAGRRKHKPPKNSPQPVGRVFSLTNENVEDEDLVHFQELITGRPIVLVDFMVDCIEEAEAGMDHQTLSQCRDSRELRPVFKKLAKVEPALTFGQVDIEAEEDLAKRFEISTAPSLALFVSGALTARYVGKPEAASISAWVRAETGLSHVKSEYDLKKLLPTRPRSEVWVVARGTAQVGNMLARTASNFTSMGERQVSHMRYVFMHTGETPDQEKDLQFEVLKGISERCQFIFSPDKEVFAEDFISYVLKERTPTFGQLSNANAGAHLQAASGALVVACFAEAAAAEKQAPAFKRLAKKFKKYHFAYVDRTADELLEQVSKCESYPSVLLQKGGVTSHHAMQAVVDEEDIAAFLKEAASKAKKKKKGDGKEEL